MESHSVSIRFLRVTLDPPDWNRFHGIVSQLLKAPASQRGRDVGGKRLLAEPHKAPSGYYFSLSKTRAKDWPYILTPGDELTEISASDGKVSETSHFWVIPERRIIIAHEHYHGPQYGDLQEYLAAVIGSYRKKSGPLNVAFHYIQERDVYEALFSRGQMKKATWSVNVAIPGDTILDQTAGTKLSPHRMTELMAKTTGAVRVKVTVSMGNRSGALSSGVLKAIYDHFSGMKTKSLKQFKVNGTLDNISGHEFDLLGLKSAVYRGQISSEKPYLSAGKVLEKMTEAMEQFNDYLPEPV